jgi:hypothetical protein
MTPIKLLEINEVNEINRNSSRKALLKKTSSDSYNEASSAISKLSDKKLNLKNLQAKIQEKKQNWKLNSERSTSRNVSTDRGHHANLSVEQAT